MNEVLLDQIPSLIDLQRYLEQLSIMEPPAMKKDIILEQVSCLNLCAWLFSLINFISYSCPPTLFQFCINYPIKYA